MKEAFQKEARAARGRVQHGRGKGLLPRTSVGVAPVPSFQGARGGSI